MRAKSSPIRSGSWISMPTRAGAVSRLFFFVNSKSTISSPSVSTPSRKWRSAPGFWGKVTRK